MDDDLQGLRLMGPAKIHFHLNLIWLFTRDGQWASNQLVYWADTRTWAPSVKARRTTFEDRYIFWPFVPLSQMLALLPEEEQAKAVAASLGVAPSA